MSLLDFGGPGKFDDGVEGFDVGDGVLDDFPKLQK